MNPSQILSRILSDCPMFFHNNTHATPQTGACRVQSPRAPDRGERADEAQTLDPARGGAPSACDAHHARQPPAAAPISPRAARRGATHGAAARAFPPLTLSTTTENKHGGGGEDPSPFARAGRGR